jgi:hypothetical protein
MKWLTGMLRYEGEECVPWPFARTTNGYARIWHNGAMRPAHRVMCEMLNGPATGEFVDTAHSCGNGHKGCMNPKHLRWASRAENSADRLSHGNDGRGERNGMAKLTQADVLAIREMAPYAVHAVIAKHYGISGAQMSRIVNGKRWAA